MTSKSSTRMATHTQGHYLSIQIESNGCLLTDNTEVSMAPLERTGQH